MVEVNMKLLSKIYNKMGMKNRWRDKCIAVLFFAGIFFSVQAQNIPVCSRTSDAWKNKYSKQETFIPSPNDPVKTIHCQFIIWQKDDGTGTWKENDPEHIKRLQSMIDLINLFWSNTQGPSDSVPGVVPLGYSNIQFEIGLKFYKNTNFYENPGLCSNFDSLDRQAIRLDAENAHYLNIHLVSCACKAGGCTNILGSHRFTDQTIIFNANHAAATDDWDDARNIAHELGHALGLRHLYNAGGPEACNTKGIDFLEDAMFPAGMNGCAAKGTCTHCYNPGGSCDPYVSKNDLCDNNLMGGGSDYKYLSPKQVGRCHRLLAVTNMSRYATGYSKHPWTISSDETWDFEIKFYQDIVIESGSTLTIKGIVHMVDNTRIVVQPGAALIIDGGVITNGGNPFPGCSDVWKEIQVQGGKIKTSNDTKRTYQTGKVEMINGGRIEKCCFGIKTNRLK